MIKHVHKISYQRANHHNCSQGCGIVGDEAHFGPLNSAATNRPIVSAPGDYDYGEIGGMIGKGNRSTRRKSTPVLFCPP
jgi:hypothetical protein